LFDFTIITPVFNGGEYLRQTIESVLSNAFDSSYEYIVVNDGSTDETSRILEDFKGKVKVINQQNSGEANAVNAGLKTALGKWALIVSADDPLISKELFHDSKNLFESHPNLAVIYPDWNVIDENGETTETKFVQDYAFEKLFSEFNCLPGPGSIFNIEFALLIGGRNPKYRYVSDYDFWLRMSQKGSFLHLPKVLAQWRSHPQSTSISSKGLQMGMERISVIKDFLTLFPQEKKLKNKALAHAYYNAALLGYFSKEVPAQKWILKALYFGKGRISAGRTIVILYLLMLPFSKYLLATARLFGIGKAPKK